MNNKLNEEIKALDAEIDKTWDYLEQEIKGERSFKLHSLKELYEKRAKLEKTLEETK